MDFTIANLIKWFQLNCPGIVRSMHNSSHHFKDGEILNPYHLEGDVWTHSMMVMLEADKLRSKLKIDEYIHVLVCALLHDIGKPLARKNSKDKERVHFWGHESISAFLCVPIVDHIEKDFNIKLNKRLIIETIAMHTDIYNVPRDKLAKRLVDNKELAEMLGYLSECDYSGRFFEIGERDMSMIEPEINHNKFIENSNPKDKKLICLVGLPCSGKSTFLKKHMLEDHKILSRDDIVMEIASENGITSYNEAFNIIDQKEVDNRFQKRRNNLIKYDGTVWVDMTNMSRKSRRKNLQGFKDFKKSAIVFMPSLEEIIRRNGNRKGKIIPDHVYEKMIIAFQPPLYDEFDEIDWEF